MAIGIAILGAGMFATEEHLPAIRAISTFSLKAIYSRSAKSAQALAKIGGEEVDAYYDTPADADRCLDALLKRSDIEAVTIAVSISKSPDLIRKAIEAGKNIISEKPIAPTVDIANSLVGLYQRQRQSKQLLWVVGENFRFWKSVNRAATIIRDLKAKLLSFRCSIYHFIGPENKYFHAEWRQEASHPAGFVLDACIHFAAIIRFLLAASGQTISKTSAHTKLIDSSLAPIDSVFAILQTDAGISGTFSFSVGIPSLDGIEYDILTDKGNVCIRGPDVVMTALKDESGKIVEDRLQDSMTFGVKEEFAAFADALTGADLDPRVSVTEALEDLKLLEAMLVSGREQGAPQSIQ